MAQTAKLLSPDKTVLLPEKAAGCPMADMIDPVALREFKAEHPGAPVVAYVNTTAEVKAESDICCTSSNAVAVVRSLKAETILFVPDQHLGRWVAKHVPEKRIILYGGFCPVHHSITPDIVADAKRHHPQAVVMAHPECPEDTLALADVVLSTGGMLNYARKSEAQEFIVVTEFGIVHPLQKENPDKVFHQIRRAVDGGLTVVMASQCINGRVNMNVYSTGRELLGMGVIPAGDMLPETALVKLMWVLGQTEDRERIRELFTANLAGELSERSEYEGGAPGGE